MPLNLHSKAKDKLRQSLVDSLEKIKVDNSIFLDFPSTLSIESANKILPSGNLQNNLRLYIGENSLFNFVFETISRDIYENGIYEPDKIGIPLKSFTNYGDLMSAATHLVDEFDSLPWSYLI